MWSSRTPRYLTRLSTASLRAALTLYSTKTMSSDWRKIRSGIPSEKWKRFRSAWKLTFAPSNTFGVKRRSRESSLEAKTTQSTCWFHTTQWANKASSVYDEEISEASCRIAAEGFYTSREDIPQVERDSYGNQRITLFGLPLKYNFSGNSKSNTNEKKLVLTDSSYISENEEESESN